MPANKEYHTVSGTELLDILNEQDWKSIIPRLHYYSLNKLQHFPQLHGRFNVNNLATYFADEAIKQLWTEERAWNNVYYADVFQFLKGAVDSLRSNFLRSKEVVATEPLPDDEIFDFKCDAENPESTLIARDLDEHIKKLFSDDVKAFEVFDGLRHGIKPRDIAGEMNVPVKTVYNAIKRIERKLFLIRKDLIN